MAKHGERSVAPTQCGVVHYELEGRVFGSNEVFSPIHIPALHADESALRVFAHRKPEPGS
jgi:hypothetical protein